MVTDGTGPLKSRVLDNTLDYLSYVLILDFFNLALIFWTYRGHAINYCCFCCDYKRYATNEYRKVDIDTTVLCFLCCGGLIETADDKRRKILEELPPPSPKSDVETGQDINTHKLKSGNSGDNENQTDKLVKKDTKSMLNKTIVSSGNMFSSGQATTHRSSDTAALKTSGVTRVAQADTIGDIVDFNAKVRRQQSTGILFVLFLVLFCFVCVFVLENERNRIENV